MFASFSTALSAMNANSTAVDIVGNNLANLNTPGYKGSAAYFHDLMAQSMGSPTTQLGFGVAPPMTIRHFTQGAIQASGGALDAAIQGDGFFVVNNQGVQQYTRHGHGCSLPACRTFRRASWSSARRAPARARVRDRWRRCDRACPAPG